MRHLIWTITATAVIGTATVTDVNAAENSRASKEETIGVGAGAIIGAAAGGPVGFIVGAAVGAKLGDTMHKKDNRIDTLTTSLDASQ